MRVLHVNKFLYRRGGAEAYMFDLAGLQSAAGHEVAFFGMDHPDNEPQPYSRFFPSYVEFRGERMPIAKRFEAAGRVLYSPSSRSGMDAVVRDFRPDVVHLHNIYHQLSPSVLRPLAARGVPAVMTLHDYKLACPSYQFLDHGRICESCVGGGFHHAVTRRCKEGSLAASLLAATESYLHAATGAYRPVAIFVCPSRFLAGKMAEAGVFPDRMRTVPHFVDAASVEVRSLPGSGFVYAGRLSPEKGVDVLVRALGRVPGAELEVLGDGPERASLERLAAAEAPGRVRFRGRVDKAEVLRAMRSAVAVVVPSRWHENQPITVLEALASGTPVVATALGGIPELVTDGENGLVVPHDDPAALAAALARLEADPGAALAMGARGRLAVAREHDPGLHLERLDALYAEAAGLTAGVA